MNYKDQRRRERQEAFDREREKHEAEVRRKAEMPLLVAIMEADASDDVKQILERIREHLGLE